MYPYFQEKKARPNEIIDSYILEIINNKPKKSACLLRRARIFRKQKFKRNQENLKKVCILFL